MPTFLSAIDLSGSEIRNVRAQNLGTDPGAPAVGQFWFDTANNVFKYRNNSVTVSLAAAVSAVPNALYDANTILKADVDDTPAALTVGASTIVGRGAAGSIAALTAAQVKTILAIANTDITGLGALATLSTVGSTEITDGSIMNIDVNASAAIALSKLATDPLARANHTGTQLASTISNFDTQVRTSTLSQMAVPTGAVSMNGQLLTGVATPVSPGDAATKAYADSVAQGLDVKTAVRVASTANVTISAPGAAIDGVTLATGNRVLLKNQTTGSENGIYTFATSATPMVRATDADSSAEVNGGMFTFVQEGTVNADNGYVLTTNNPITLGTTALAFTQFSGSGNIVGTTNRITVTGTQVDISSAYVGQATITTLGTVTTGTWTGTTIAVANGGTGATTAAGAKTNLGYTTKYATLIGNASATTFTITHSLGTEDVTCEIYDATTKATVYANVTRASTNTLTLDGFTTAPATNGLRVVVTG